MGFQQKYAPGMLPEFLVVFFSEILPKYILSDCFTAFVLVFLLGFSKGPTEFLSELPLYLLAGLLPDMFPRRPIFAGISSKVPLEISPIVLPGVSH